MLLNIYVYSQTTAATTVAYIVYNKTTAGQKQTESTNSKSTTNATYEQRNTP